MFTSQVTNRRWVSWTNFRFTNWLPTSTRRYLINYLFTFAAVWLRVGGANYLLANGVATITAVPGIN